MSNARFAVTSPKAEKLGSPPQTLDWMQSISTSTTMKTNDIFFQLPVPCQIHILMKILGLRNRFTTSLGCNQFPVTLISTEGALRRPLASELTQKDRSTKRQKDETTEKL